jgi:subtilase family serine protease
MQWADRYAARFGSVPPAVIGQSTGGLASSNHEFVVITHIAPFPHLERIHMKNLAAPVLGALALVAGTVGGAYAAVPQHSSGTESTAALRAEVAHNTLEKTHGVYMACAARGMTCEYGYVTRSKGSTMPLLGTSPVGYGADVLEDAYGLKKAPSENATVAIIGAAYYDPAVLESSLASYRSEYGLPACTIKSGCLTVTGYKSDKLKPPKTDTQKQAAEQIGLETSLDVEMVSAACPSCKIVEVQTPWGDGYYHPHKPARDELSTLHFGEAVQRAVKDFGASAVSMSYGLRMDSTTAKGKYAKNLDIKGVGIFGSTGDSGYDHYFTDTSAWPEGLTTVAAVGGTVLTKSGNGYTEMAWSGGGSSCTAYLGAAVGQPASVAKNCKGQRATSDISAVAHLVAVYDGYAPSSGTPYQWVAVDGTSISSPLMAGMAARAGVPSSMRGPNILYSGKASNFNDITTGSNGTTCGSDGMSTKKMCNAGKGWDGPTGLGSPKGLAAFQG